MGEQGGVLTAPGGPAADEAKGPRPVPDPPATEPEATRTATTYIVLRLIAKGESDGQLWELVGRVQARTRESALEEAEGRWGDTLAEDDEPRLHLVPERFWKEIRGHKVQPPARIEWEGV